MIAQLIDRDSVTLRDGREVVIRSLTDSDRTALTAFADDLVRGDLQYIPDDLQTPEMIARQVIPPAAGYCRRLVAVAEDRIVGYAAVRRFSGWSREVGEVQLVVSAGWRSSDLGCALAEALLDAAHELEVTELIVELLEEQVDDRMIFEWLGFSIEGVLEGQICDRHGRHYNLLVMAHQIDDEQRQFATKVTAEPLATC